MLSFWLGYILGLSGLFFFIYNLFFFKIVWIMLEFFMLFLMFYFIICNVWGLYFGTYIYMNSGLIFDNLSCFLVVLSIFMLFIMMLVSKIEYDNKDIYFLFLIIMLFFFIIFSFMTLNLLYFFILFEGSIIPMIFLIMGWGKSPERKSAMIYFMFYTLLGSLPLFLSFLYVDYVFFSFDFTYLMNLVIFSLDNFYLEFWLFMGIFSFLVKAPIYGVHLWLPKAHVEAPISGSVFLAAILLKLSGYGFIRSYYFFIDSIISFSSFYISVFFMGSVISSIVCLSQSDMKKLIAYSSVSHMGLVFVGLFTLMSLGFSGSFMVMISHGFTSSGLFVIVYFIQNRSGSREFCMTKGLLSVLPVMTLFFYFLILMNMSAPISLGLVGELSLFSVMMFWDYLLLVLIILYVSFGSYYSIRLFQDLQLGNLNNYYFYNYLNVREIYLLFYHVFPVNLFIFSLDLFLII